MLLKHRFLLIMSAAFSCTMPLSLSAANQAFPASPVSAGSGSSAGIAAWYLARQQQINSHHIDLGELLARAKAGDTDAQYELGLVYQSGRDAPQDLALARRWFNSAAQAGNVYAQYSLALLLREQGGQANLQRSVQLQEKAALGGNPEAQYGLGMLYANGQYVSRDLHNARHWLKQAQIRGNMTAQLALLELPAPPPVQPVARKPVQRPATARMQPKVAARPLKPLKPLTQSSAKRAALAEPALAALPAGKAGRRGPNSAGQRGQSSAGAQAARLSAEGLSAKQLLSAAQQGDMYAQLMLGALYEDGKGGVEQSSEMALRWYLKSARQGYPKAQHNLALLYEDGRGIKQDYQQAAIWYEKAANSGFSESQNNLAVLHILGRGVKEDRAYAEELLHQAVAEGNANAKRNLNMLLNGAG